MSFWNTKTKEKKNFWGAPTEASSPVDVEPKKEKTNFWGGIKNAGKKLIETDKKILNKIDSTIKTGADNIKESITNPRSMLTHLDTIFPTWEETKMISGQVPDATPEQIAQAKRKGVDAAMILSVGNLESGAGKNAKNFFNKVNKNKGVVPGDPKATLQNVEQKLGVKPTNFWDNAKVESKPVPAPELPKPTVQTSSNPIVQEQKPPVAENFWDASSSKSVAPEKSHLKYNLDGEYLPYTPRQKQIVETGKIPPSKIRVPLKDINLSDDLAQKELSIAQRREILDNDPVKPLAKYMNHRTGSVPEAVGYGKSKFARSGDDIANLNGFEDSEALREEIPRYLAKRKQLIMDEKAFKAEKKNYLDSVRDKIALEKQAKLSERSYASKPAPDKKKLALIEEGQRNALAREAKEARKVVNYNNAREPQSTPKGFWGKTKQSLNPMKSLDNETQDIFRKWNSSTLKARELANKEMGTINSQAGKEGFETIKSFQRGEATAKSSVIKKKFDDLFNEARARGHDVDYRQNYLPQVWQESREEMQKKIGKYLTEKGLDPKEVQAYMQGIPLRPETAKRLGLTPKYAKERVFPDYETGMKYGLTPKYSNADQLAAHYREDMEKAIANREFISALQEKGKILPVEFAPDNWSPVSLPFSTKGYYAEPNLARTLNGLFADEASIGASRSLSSNMAWASRRAQEIALSAGIPKSNFNFFSIGQVIKEMTSGNFGAIKPFVRANFNNASIKYFQANQKYLEMMADEGLDLGKHIASYDQTYKPLFDSRTFKTKVGDGFDKMFNEKTFGSFLPQMHLQSFKDVYESAIKKGLSEIDARKLAGDTIENAFGLTRFTGRSQATDDVLSSVFFAPRFRESILKTLGNTGKAGVEFVRLMGGLRGKLTPALSKNRKLLAGMIMSFGMYNALNYKLNGHFMWDNPENRKFALQIPSKNGELIYVEFMPSFLAFARNMASGVLATAGGDLETATQKFGSVMSMPLKTMTELLSNEDYFGNPIYNNSDTTAQKAAKMAAHSGLTVAHPYIKEAINQINQKKPLHQSILTALELPLKFSSTDKVRTNEVYDLVDEQDKERNRSNEYADKLYARLKEMPKDEANAEYQALVESNPSMAQKIYNRIEEDKLGLTSSEKAIKRLGVGNEMRAKYLAEEFSKLETVEEKRELWYNYVQKKIITEQVAKQITELLAK